MHIDSVLESLGESGYYPYVPYVFMCFVVVARAWHILAMSFLGWTPEFECVLNSTAPDEYVPALSKDQLSEDHRKYDYHCYAINSTGSSVECSDASGTITFMNQSTSARSIVEEWNYTCDDAEFFWIFRYQDLGKTFYVLGALFGYIFVAPSADKLGRKPVTLICTWVMGLVGLASLLTHHVAAFYVIRFIGGLCYAGTGVVWSWTAEIFSQKTRTTPVVLLDIAYTTGVMTLPAMAYGIPGWKLLYVVLSIGSLLTIPLWWLCPESIKWLYSAGKEKRGRELLEKLAKQKNIKLPDKIETELTEEMPKGDQAEKLLLENNHEKAPTKKWTATVIIVTALVAFIRAVVSMYYYGLSFNTNAFSGSRYLNFFLFGAIEVPAILLVVFMLKVSSRRFNVFIFLLLSGSALAFLAIARLASADISKMHVLRLVLTLFGKFSITAAYAAIDTYGSEVFPTEVRASCYGVIGAASRVSSLASTLAESVLKTYPLIPEALFGFATLVAALMMLYCPETKGRPIPQRAADLDLLKANTTFCFCGLGSAPLVHDVEDSKPGSNAVNEEAM